MPLRQSFCYPCFKTPETSLADLCRAAAGIGYAGVELWFRDDQFEPLLEAAAGAGLAVASMCGHRSIAEGMNRRANHARIEEELRASIEIAVRHRIPNLICFSGNRNEGQADGDALDAMAECLARVAPAAERAGVNLNIELLNSKVNHPGYQADRTAWGVAVCRAVGSTRVKLLYDIYHMQIMEGDVIRTIRENIAHLGHFHTAGNPGRQDLDDRQELCYPAICRAIAESGFHGFVAHEFTPRGDRIAALRDAFTQCRG